MSEKFTWGPDDIVIDISDDDKLFRALSGYDDELEVHEEPERKKDDGNEEKDS